MSRDFENPFAYYGTIVHGDRFIGRKYDLQVIESRVLRPREPGNLAIIGDSRIGKSSLVYKAVIDKKNELIANKLLPIWINLSNYNHAHDFFCSLVESCVYELEDLNWLSPNIQRMAERVLNNNYSWNENYRQIQRFFEKVRKSGVKILFVLDEFDHARHLFCRNISAFQGLRELSYRPEWRVYFIITSRRTIRDIEIQTQSISTFDGIFHKHYLGMFNESDIAEYFCRFDFIGLSNKNVLKEQITFYCGGHPYLLDMLGYELVEMFRYNQSIDVDEAAQRLLPSFLGQYERMVELLREEGILAKLLQILIGPTVNVRWTDVEKLLKYGFIKKNGENNYSAFSEHFHSYLKIIERQFGMEFWPIWQQTETALRKAINYVMTQEYGSNWIEYVEKSKSNLKNIFNRCREAQTREKRSFGNRASDDLLDFTYPVDLFTIMFAEWNIFKDILGKDKSYWSQRAQLLSKIRNPVAHNRIENIPGYELQIAEGYCKEILSIINSCGVI